MFFDFFRIALNSLRNRKTRTLLTLVGIIIGVGLVFTLISLSQGFQNSLNEEFQKLGLNRFTVAPGGSAGFGPMGGSISAAQLDSSDLEVVRDIPGVEAAMGVLSKTAKVEYKKQVEYQSLWGTDTEDPDALEQVEEMSQFELENGRQLESGDQYHVILGSAIPDNFDKDVHVGSQLLIKDIPFKVVGIQKSSGMPMQDIVIRLPMSTLRDMYDEPERVTTIFAKVKDGIDVNKVIEIAEVKLRKHRDVKEGEEDFSVQSAQQTFDAFSNILLIVQVVLIGIAFISLIVGTVGIMNTMYTSVTERKKEIGIMKSVGARNNQIATLFLIESGFLGLLGGIIGISFGVLIAKSVEGAALAGGVDFFKAAITPELIIGSLLFAFIIGAIAGTLPAWNASKLKPVDALRGY
ncbi:ABC transporter permease [Nanoarchaeota archaeon]